MRKLTVNSYIIFKEMYDELKSQHKEDKALTLASMCGHGVIQELVDNETSLETPTSEFYNFSPNAVYDYPDSILIMMFSNFFKPLTPTEYGEKLYEAYRGPLRPKSKGWKFGINGYHRELFAPVNELFYRIKDIHDILTKAKANDGSEDKNFPEVGWGKKEKPGLFRYFMHCMHVFEKPFIQAMPLQEESLKQCKTVSAFFKLIKDTNAALSRFSRDVERTELGLAVPATLQETFPLYEVNGEPRGPRGSERVVDGTLKLISEADSEGQRRTIYDCTHDENEADNENEIELYFNRTITDNTNRNHAVTNATARHGDKDKTKLYYDKPAEHKLPCYAYTYDRNCTFGAACVYSHDDKVCSAYVEKQLKMFAKSPFLNARVKDAINQSYSSHTSANNSVSAKPVYKMLTGNAGKAFLVDASDERFPETQSAKLSDAKATHDD